MLQRRKSPLEELAAQGYLHVKLVNGSHVSQTYWDSRLVEEGRGLYWNLEKYMSYEAALVSPLTGELPRPIAARLATIPNVYISNVPSLSLTENSRITAPSAGDENV